MAGRTGKHLRMGGIYLCFLAVLLVCALMLHGIYILYAADKMRDEVRTEREHLLSQELRQGERYLQEIEAVENTLFRSERLQNLLVERSRIDYLVYADGRDLLSEYQMGPYGLHAIDLYVLSTKTLVTSSQGVFYHLEDQDAAVYEEFLTKAGNGFWTDTYQGREPKLVARTRNARYLTHVQPVRSLYSGKVKALMLVSVPYANFEKYTAIALENESTAIFFGETQIAGRLPESMEGQQLLEKSAEMDPFSAKYSFQYNWQMLLSRRLFLFIGFVALLFLLGFAMIVLISEQRVARPVNRLLAGFRAVESGRLTEPIEQTEDPIFGDLNRGFNHMTEHLDQTLTALVDEKTRAKELETRLLMMQIRPHFLYNIFNNMIWLTEQKQYEALESLVEATAGYYRTALNGGEKDILLLENERQLSCYAVIQKMRFGDTFDLEIRLSDEAQTCRVPNMILQPLVENAIVHGFQNLDRRGRVELNAELQGEQVWITVQDNGCGIPAELLEEIRSAMADAQEPSSRFFALVNISLLLKLRYGEKAEIYIDSTPGEGTKVSLILPVEGEA